MDLKQLGKNIFAVRRRLGKTQEDVAFDLGISTTSYAKIERGETNVPFLRLVQIADLFNVEVSEFVLVSSYEDERKIGLLINEISHIKTDIEYIKRLLINK